LFFGDALSNPLNPLGLLKLEGDFGVRFTLSVIDLIFGVVGLLAFIIGPFTMFFYPNLFLGLFGLFIFFFDEFF